MKAGITLDPGARFLTGATLRLTLECRTEEFNFFESGGSQNQAQLKLRTATQRVSADRIEVELALDEAATVSAPPTHSVLDSQHCFAAAILQVTYQASPDVLPSTQPLLHLRHVVPPPLLQPRRPTRGRERRAGRRQAKVLEDPLHREKSDQSAFCPLGSPVPISGAHQRCPQSAPGSPTRTRRSRPPAARESVFGEPRRARPDRA